MKHLSITVAAVLLIGAFTSAFIVPQGENAMRYSVLAPEKTRVLLDPGMHVKIPIIQKVTSIDLRPQLLTADGSTEKPYLSLQTFDKQNLEIGYNAIWQITDAKAYYQAALEHQFNDQLRSNLDKNLALSLESLTLEQLLSRNVRQATVEQVIDSTNKQSNNIGIKVIAIHLSSITVPDNERQTWLNHMKALQEGQLAQLQLQTSTLAQSLKSETENKAAQIIADGKKQADKIRAEANAKAASVYNEAYQKDPAFYEFYHNLQAYQEVLTPQDVLILGTDNTFFKSLSPNSNSQ